MNTYVVKFLKNKQVVHLESVLADSYEKALEKGNRLLGKKAREANLTVRVIGPVARKKNQRMKYRDTTLFMKG